MIIRGRYFARIIRVIDGDTCLAEFPCPTCGVSSQQRLRLARIDAPELDGPRNVEGLASKHRLEEIIGGATVEVQVCQKWPDKYGRIIVEIVTHGVNVSNQLVEEGYAVWYRCRAERVSREIPYSERLSKFHQRSRPSDLDHTADGASIVE